MAKSPGHQKRPEYKVEERHIGDRLAAVESYRSALERNPGPRQPALRGVPARRRRLRLHARGGGGTGPGRPAAPLWPG